MTTLLTPVPSPPTPGGGPTNTRSFTMHHLMYEDLARARQARTDGSERAGVRRTSLRIALEARRENRRQLSR